MASEASIDLIPLERQLQHLTASIRSEDDEQSWLKVQSICQELANHLRVRNGPGELSCVLEFSTEFLTDPIKWTIIPALEKPNFLKL